MASNLQFSFNKIKIFEGFKVDSVNYFVDYYPGQTIWPQEYILFV